MINKMFIANKISSTKKNNKLMEKFTKLKIKKSKSKKLVNF